MKKGTYFTEDFLEFFRQLAANNNKEWFDDNRKMYEQAVKEPFKKFITDLIAEISKHDSRVNIKPNDAIFRINRDIRFSPDKAPYKLDRSAIVSPKGRKDHSTPGVYVSFGPEFAYIGGGAYFLESTQLHRMRSHIIDNIHRFNELINEEAFKSTYGEIKGEENKRLPAEFKEAAEKQALLYKKQFYYMAQHNPEIILDPNLMNIVMDHYKASYPLQCFLTEALD